MNLHKMNQLMIELMSEIESANWALDVAYNEERQLLIDMAVDVKNLSKKVIKLNGLKDGKY